MSDLHLNLPPDTRRVGDPAPASDHNLIVKGIRQLAEHLNGADDWIAELLAMPDSQIRETLMTLLGNSPGLAEEVVAAIERRSLVEATGVRRIIASTDSQTPLQEGDLLLVYAPPTSMFTDFATAPIGEIPPGWTERWVIPTINGWKMESLPSATGGRALVHRGADNARRALTWDTLDGMDVDDVEIVFKWMTSSSGNPARGLIRGSGEAGTEQGYLGGVRNASAQAMNKFVAGTGTLPLGPTAPIVISSLTWNITRLRVQGGQLSSKTWKAADPEPQDWTLTTADADITGGGWVGLHAFGAGVMSFDWIGVSLDSAPAPKGP